VRESQGKERRRCKGQAVSLGLLRPSPKDACSAMLLKLLKMMNNWP